MKDGVEGSQMKLWLERLPGEQQHGYALKPHRCVRLRHTEHEHLLKGAPFGSADYDHPHHPS